MQQLHILRNHKNVTECLFADVFSVGKHTFYCTEENKLQLEFNSIASPVFSHTKQQHVDLTMLKGPL